MNTVTIIRIVEVVDTRQYEEVGDRWVPIPGSGNIRECSRCKREHEIHATVELSDGTTDVVGTGCASRDAMDLAPQFRSGESRAKRVAALRAEVAGLERFVAEYRAACAAVDALSVPEVTVVEAPPRAADGGPLWFVHCGDATVCAHDVRPYYLPERLQCARGAWRRLRLEALGITYKHHGAVNALADVRKRLAKLTERDA